MRALALLLLTSGCLISAPEGAAQTWTPKLGGSVEAVVAGDLDADGASDVVVMMAGSESQAGLYVIHSDVDLVWDSTENVRSFSTFVPRELVRPTAAYFDNSVVPRIYLATGAETLTATSLSNTLNEVATEETDIAGTAWIKPMVFPGNQVHFAVSNGSQIEHLSVTFTDPRPLPPPMMMTSWNLAQTVSSYVDGDTIAVVATASMVYRCIIPTTPGSPFDWQPVRTMMAQWSGQMTHDLDGDLREEVIGYDVNTKQLCVVDPGAATLPVTPSCITMNTDANGTDVTIFAGYNISMSPGLDILVVQASGTDTRYALAEDVTFSAGTLTATATPPIPFMGPARGRTVVAGPGGGRPVSVITFGTDGQAVCALGPC
jgi:hypothetical protein